MGDDLTTLWYRFNQGSYPMLGGYLKYLGFFFFKLEPLICGSLKTLKDLTGNILGSYLTFSKKQIFLRTMIIHQNRLFDFVENHGYEP